jgi:hypothetical protein
LTKIPKFLQRRLQPVQQGWEPVSEEYAAQYESGEWKQTFLFGETLDLIERWCGPFTRKRVLHLGSGLGHFSIAMALRSADASGHHPDNSKARSRCSLPLTYSIGYLEDASRLVDEP